MIKWVLMIFILCSAFIAIVIYSAFVVGKKCDEADAIDDLEEQWEQIHKKS